MIRFTFLFVLIVSLHLTSACSAKNSEPVPHLDPEMESEEYAPYLQKASKEADEPEIANALHLGTRLAAWIQHENERRPADRQLRLTSAGTRTGIPIETPSQYNPKIIGERVQKVLDEMPAPMRDVLTTRLAYPEILPLSDEEFVRLGRLLDRAYQSAARWKTLKPYISYYTSARTRDVRGYYYLQKNQWTAERLNGFNNLDEATQTQLREWLLLLCLNPGTPQSHCQSRLDLSIAQDRVGEFYTQYLPAGDNNWRAFFDIPPYAVRRDIQWTSASPNFATIPFIRPSNPVIEAYLRDNVEDEFKWNDWKLRLRFGDFATGPRVRFQPGVVPHVEGLGGDQIVMDENQSIEEYESQWTIRHEFAHILGLPDCYHEFYDPATASFINYQLDITDLMCSRAGNMNERIYNELKRVYFK